MHAHSLKHTSTIKQRLIHSISISGLALVLIACGESDKDSSNRSTSPSGELKEPNTSTKQQIDLSSPDQAVTAISLPPLASTYLKQASQSFESASASVGHLNVAINELLVNPKNENLDKARVKWIDAHNDYVATRTYSYINIKHPLLDHTQLEPVQHAQVIRIDQAPLLPGYLDRVKDYPQSGYVYSPLPIDEATLNKEHQFSDELYVTIGFHSLEFLLWGESSESPRKSSEFAAVSTELTDEEHPAYYAIRRTMLTKQISELLRQDIEKQSNEWASKGYYPSHLMKLSVENQIAYINESIQQSLNHILLQQASLKTQEGKSSHAAYSNTDLRDLITQLKGIQKLLNSEEWINANTVNKKRTKPAKALLLQYSQLAKSYKLN